MAPTALMWPRFSATRMIATGAIRTIASVWKVGAVKLGRPIHGAAASWVKSIGLPKPRPFANSKYKRYPPIAPRMIGRRRHRPGAATATTPMIRTVASPIQVSNVPALTALTATGARLRPIAATTAPVTAGGSSLSTQPTPDHITISAITP